MGAHCQPLARRNKGTPALCLLVVVLLLLDRVHRMFPWRLRHSEQPRSNLLPTRPSSVQSPAKESRGNLETTPHAGWEDRWESMNSATRCFAVYSAHYNPSVWRALLSLPQFSSTGSSGVSPSSIDSYLLDCLNAVHLERRDVRGSESGGNLFVTFPAPPARHHSLVDALQRNPGNPRHQDMLTIPTSYHPSITEYDHAWKAAQDGGMVGHAGKSFIGDASRVDVFGRLPLLSGTGGAEIGDETVANDPSEQAITWDLSLYQLTACVSAGWSRFVKEFLPPIVDNAWAELRRHPGGWTIPVHFCFHTRESASVKWMHLHTFTGELPLENLPTESGDEGYCAHAELTAVATSLDGSSPHGGDVKLSEVELKGFEPSRIAGDILRLVRTSK